MAHLELFSAVVEAGRFNVAARALGMTQSGVSRGVARLEAELGVRLFDRSARSVRLTDEGRRLHAELRPLLTQLHQALERATQAQAQVRGRLRVNVDPFLSRLLLAPRVGELLAAHPNLEIQLLVRERLGDLVADGFDVALRFGFPPPSALIARKLLETRILTVAAPRYLKAHPPLRQPEDLASPAHECLLFIDPVTGTPFDWELHRGREVKPVRPRGRLTVTDVGLAQDLCLNGQAVAQLMELGIEHHLRAGRLVPCFPGWNDEPWPLYAYFASRRHPPAKVRVFLDFVREVLSKRPA